MLLASTLGQIAHPFYVAFAWLLAAYYSFIPNYAVAIALLTITVMVVVFPITRRGTRSMMRMQLLAPEMKALQARHKAQAGATQAERAASRQELNTEMMALYKENGVSPAGGCAPMLLQFPIFIILYGTIRGLIHTTKNGRPAPLYIGSHTRLYHDVFAHPGHLNAFGINLADSALTHGISTGARIALVAMIVVAIVLQYVQMKQMSGRNPAARAANPQMQQMQKVMPLIFAVIYIRISAGVNVYFIVSSLFRIAQQEFMYRHDPHITGALEKLRAQHKTDPKVLEAKRVIEGERPKGFRARIAAAAGLEAAEPQKALPRAGGATPQRSTGSGSSSARANGTRNGAAKKQPGASANGAKKSAASSARSGPPVPRAQPRAQDKRRRKPR
ncbi:MAG: 60 kDa inner rane insertion protein [Acidimicrobiaceae bacterium]|nr:60 kDa inner rane insertion protein [Acidimicrobiaceae bacterium]